MANVYLIAGLGNPGPEYAATRHNAGFMLADRLAARWRADWRMEKKFSARVARAERAEHKVILCQPQTFMNESGAALGAIARFYQTPAERVLVAVDDADLPLGQIRLRPDGSSGGHHGLDSVERQLGTRAYPRLRLGIGRRVADEREITGYVLGRFTAEETKLMDAVLDRAVQQVECWLDAGIVAAMNEFNGAVSAPADKRKQVKRYEGLFILNTVGKEESIKDAIDKITAEITQAGGKVETVQKMDKKPFSRTPDRKMTSGFYVNFVFEGAPAIVTQLRHRFVNNEEIYRVLFTEAPAPKEETEKLAKA